MPFDENKADFVKKSNAKLIGLSICRSKFTPRDGQDTSPPAVIHSDRKTAAHSMMGKDMTLKISSTNRISVFDIPMV